MSKQPPFSEVLDELIKQDGRHLRRVARATEKAFGMAGAVSLGTMTRWFTGKGEKPLYWQDVVKVAIVLELTEEKTDELLQLASHPTVSYLRRKTTNRKELALLAHWSEDGTAVADLGL